MSTATQIVKPVMPERHYLNDNYGIRSWLLTKDHKRIAILYLFSITVFFLFGGMFAVADPAAPAHAERRVVSG